jgi:hypothetical protein
MKEATIETTNAIITSSSNHLLGILLSSEGLLVVEVGLEGF